MATELMQPEQEKKERQVDGRGEMTRNVTAFVPRVDILVKDDEIVLFADMPGVETDNLDIRFKESQLTIHGKVDFRHSDMTFVGGEYGIGDFCRTFVIGEAIDADEISADMKDGVLTLHLPKSQSAKLRKIEVKAG